MDVTFRDKWRVFFGAIWRSAGSAQIVINSTFLDAERRGDLDDGQALFSIPAPPEPASAHRGGAHASSRTLLGCGGGAHGMRLAMIYSVLRMSVTNCRWRRRLGQDRKSDLDACINLDHRVPPSSGECPTRNFLTGAGGEEREWVQARSGRERWSLFGKMVRAYAKFSQLARGYELSLNGPETSRRKDGIWPGSKSTGRHCVIARMPRRAIF
jgi:hypothetical protein